MVAADPAADDRSRLPDWVDSVAGLLSKAGTWKLTRSDQRLFGSALLEVAAAIDHRDAAAMRVARVHLIDLDARRFGGIAETAQARPLGTVLLERTNELVHRLTVFATELRAQQIGSAPATPLGPGGGGRLPGKAGNSGGVTGARS